MLWIWRVTTRWVKRWITHVFSILSYVYTLSTGVLPIPRTRLLFSSQWPSTLSIQKQSIRFSACSVVEILLKQAISIIYQQQSLKIPFPSSSFSLPSPSIHPISSPIEWKHEIRRVWGNFNSGEYLHTSFSHPQDQVVVLLFLWVPQKPPFLRAFPWLIFRSK